MRQKKIKTMEDFAAVVGISRPTLSKYFNDPGSVRGSTRDRIEAALRIHDYTPNIYAINQNRRLTRNIGIVVPFLADPFFAEVARILEPPCIAAGFNPILLSSHGDPDREMENLASLRAIKPAGVLLAPLGRGSHRDGIEAFCGTVPTVLFDCDIEGVGVAAYGSNNMQSVGLIVEYLCRTGEPPAFLEMRTPPNPNANKRRAAYEHAMRGQGHPPMVLQADGDGWAFEDIGYRAGLALIANRDLPTDTVLCSNDRIAIGFIAAAYERGRRVGIGPGHALRVAGHDDHPYSKFTCPALTTVAQDYDSISRSSIEKLLSIIDSGARPAAREMRLYDGTLVMRGSA